MSENNVEKRLAEALEDAKATESVPVHLIQEECLRIALDEDVEGNQ